MSDNEDVRTFQLKFEIPMPEQAQALEESASKFRLKFMQEELNEYELAVAADDLETQFDSLLDLVYVAHGTALMHGFPWAEGWRRVQDANMAKIAVRNTNRTGRHALDVVKPEGWTAPTHIDLIDGSRAFPFRPHIVLLEGPDGVGKSILADALQILTGVPHVHFSAPKNGASFDDICRAYTNEIALYSKSVIIDRFHLSEQVYGPILRGVDTMRDDFEAMLCAMTRPIVVLCLPPFEVAQQNWSRRNAERAELVEQREQYEAVYRGYQSIRTILPCLQYDYTRDSAVDVLNRLRAVGCSI